MPALWELVLCWLQVDEEKNRLEKEAERLVELGDDPSAQVMLEDVYER